MIENKLLNLSYNEGKGDDKREAYGKELLQYFNENSTDVPEHLKGYLQRLIINSIPRKVEERKIFKQRNKEYFCGTCGQNLTMHYDARGTKIIACPYCATSIKGQKVKPINKSSK